MSEEHHKKKEESITLNKSTVWMIATFVLGGLFVLSLFTGGFGIKKADAYVAPSAGNLPSQPTPSVPSGVAPVSARELVDDDPYLGKKDAPLVMVEFSDFQCPFCARFRQQAFDQIKQQYVDTGKVKFVYRDFPLESIHPTARKAAEASECADEQGKFWEYHDKIFEDQTALSLDSLKQWAKDLGLDANKFNTCLDSNKYADEVTKDLDDATKSGGRGT